MSTAVLLTGHGTIAELADIPGFLKNIRRGAPTPDSLVSEMQHRYEAIGGSSPLTAICTDLAAKVGAELDLPARFASRLWHPYVKDVLTELRAQGVTEVLTAALAQFSAHVYHAHVREMAEPLGMSVREVPNWGGSPALVDAFGKRIAALKPSADDYVVLSAHSLPQMVVDAGDKYPELVQHAAQRIAASANLGERWGLYYQSQGASAGPGGRPMVWIGPDLKAAIETAKAQGAKRMVFAPIGFLADHVEVLFDLDIEARKWVEDAGMQYVRMESLNAHSDLVTLLASQLRDART